MTDALPSSLAKRVTAWNWSRLAEDLDRYGCAIIENLLTADECTSIAASYPQDGQFRNRIVMSRHGFGRGEYKYFAYPLPGLVASLREALYAPLAQIANRWNEALGEKPCYPERHSAFLERCHKAGQRRPTPLLLQYGEGDYKVNLRHGVSRVRSGHRHTLGIIFHDAE